MPTARPERSCIACRSKGAKGGLIKLASGPSGVVIDYTEKFPGRGAYVCAEMVCIEKALDERLLSKAFRHKTVPPAKDEFYGELGRKVEKKIESLLGIGRKSGLVVYGFDACVHAAKERPNGLLILAGDISEDTERRLVSKACVGPRPARVSYSGKDRLGELLGTSPVAVVFINDGGLAEALEREIKRFVLLINRG